MQPRYFDGTKVRIRTKDATGQVVYRELEEYENMAGEVIGSRAVVAYFARPVTFMPDQRGTLYMYTVKLDEGVTLYNLAEYCLEPAAASL